MENNTQKPQVDKKLKYILIALVVILIAAVTVIVLNFSGSDGENETVVNTAAATQEVPEVTAENSAESGETEETAQAEEKTYTPTFMYFVSKNDSGYTEYMSMIEELKAQYSNDVTFDIVDVDEEPESKENFPVEGNTPMLIMTNTSNDISAIEFKCSDKERLSADIEAALNK